MNARCVMLAASLAAGACSRCSSRRAACKSAPRARLLGYRETLFRGEATVLAPGTAVRDAAAIGYPQRFASLKLQCEA